MSKPLPLGQQPPKVDPKDQVKQFADLYRSSVSPEVLENFSQRTRELDLEFSDDEVMVLAAIDTPDKVQQFLNTQIYYNNDHSIDAVEQTAMSPRQVLRTALAHCFEGAMLAYAANYLHGHSPLLVLLEGSQDSEHNLVLFKDKKTGLLGVNAHSAFLHLDGRPAEFHSIREIAETYYPYYYSDRTMDPEDRTLVGYSEPFDLVRKYGTAWMTSEQPLWDIYYTYVDDTVRLHYLFDDRLTPHDYPLIAALKAGWIRVDEDNRPSVVVANLPPAGQALWDEFWSAFDTLQPKPRGAAREIELEFFKLTGTTPIDLNENADELASFLERGYKLDRLLTRPS